MGFTDFEIFMWGTIAVNVIFSLIGFSNRELFNKYKFHVGAILQGKEYIRMLSSAFLHGSYIHLALNMFVFWSFSSALQHFVGLWQIVIIYYVSLFAGNMLALFFHRNNPNYSAIGASGAVSGIVFASIMFYPHGEIIFVFLPMFPIPSWIFGILYLLYTVYGMSRNTDNIGHEAHMGGALAGLLLAFIFRPDLAMENKLISAALLIVPLFMLFIRPKERSSSGFEFNVQNDRKPTARTKRSIDDLYYNEAFEREKELDRLLEKVAERGIESLSLQEQKRLKELSEDAK